MTRLLLLALVLTGCGQSPTPLPPSSVEGESVAESGVPCIAPSPLASPPTELPVVLPPGSVLTDVTVLAGRRLVSGQLEAPVDEVLDHFRRDPGFVVTRDEDEGRAGRLELFGTAGDVAVTVALLTCPRGLTGFTISVPERPATQPSPAG